MALNQWSKRLLVLVAAICGVGGFLIGSSSSQEEVKREADQGEIGRYQMIVSSPPEIFMFDTKAARFWHINFNVAGNPNQWEAYPGPFDKAAPESN